MATALPERDGADRADAAERARLVRELTRGVGELLLDAARHVPPLDPADTWMVSRRLLHGGQLMPRTAVNATTMAAFRRERDAALRSLDRTQLRAYCAKYGVRMPADESPDGAFWAGVHKARVACLDLTARERQVSREWLTAHGYQPELRSPEAR